MPSQYVNLMPKDQDLGCQRGPRSEQYYQRRPDQAASFSHKIETLRDSASLASRIRFPTGTMRIADGKQCPRNGNWKICGGSLAKPPIIEVSAEIGGWHGIDEACLSRGHPDDTEMRP